MNKEYKIKLDLNKKLYNKKMTFNQFDENVNDFYIEVTKNNELLKDLDKSIITLVVIKPNGEVDAQFIETKEGQVYANLKPSMCDLVGNYQAKAMIVLEGEIVTTDTINYSVNEDKIISKLNEDVVSDERFTLFTDALARLSTIEISEEQRMINEAERILSEENRKIEEAKRVESELIRQHEEADRAKYDATRESNENIRKQNESIRLANETNRIDEESKRVEEENKRKLAEEERNANYNFMTEDEERRRSEANAHKEAEVLRVQAETDRVNEEAKRRNTEQARVSAENTRVSNENVRETNEVVRKNNETKRVEAETQRQNRYNSFIVDAEANANNFENYTNTAKVKEEERKANELTRKNQETQRVSNENERLANEETRKANEVVREENEISRQDIFEDKVDEFNEKITELNTTKDNFISSVNTKVDTKISELDTAKSDMTTTVSNKVNEVETRFNALTSKQQQDAEVIDARDGETSLKARLDRDIEKAKQVYVNVEGSHISTDSSVGYAKDVEILGNTIQSASNLADIRSVGDTVEGQELYEIPVLSCGKNLFSLSEEEKSAVDTIYKLPIKDGVDYSFSSLDNVKYDLMKFKGDSHVGWYVSSHYNPTVDIKLDENHDNVRIRFKVDASFKRFQLEEGTQATPYEPYVEDKLTILSPVQLEKVGDVADRIIEKDGVWGVEKNISNIYPTFGYNTTYLGFYLYYYILNDIIDTSEGNKIYYLSNRNIVTFNDRFKNLEEGNTYVTPTKWVYVATQMEKSDFENTYNGKVLVKYPTTQPQFIPLPHSQQIKLRTLANKTNISFGCEIEGTIKAQVPKSLGATVNTHTEQINNLNKELDRVKKLEESTVSTVTTESDFTTVEATSNGYFEDVKLEGRTLVNLFDYSTPFNTHWEDITISQGFKPNTKYTFIIQSSGDASSLMLGVLNTSGNWSCLKEPYDVGSSIFMLTTDSNPTNTIRMGTLSPSGVVVTYNKIIILEGDHTQNPPSYFEGLKSVGQSASEDEVDEIVVSSVNENLLNIEKVFNKDNVKVGTYNAFTVRGLKPNTIYTFEKYNEIPLGKGFSINISDVANITNEGKFIYHNSNGNVNLINIKSTPNGELYFNTNIGTPYSSITLDDLNESISLLGDMCLYEGESLKPYTPHQSDKKRLLYYNNETQAWEKPILRQWDSIEKHADGKYYYHQRSGEVVLNGSETWTTLDVKENTIQFVAYPSNVINNSILICDKFKYNGDGSDTERINYTTSFYLNILKSKLSTQDVQGLKQWLQTNNVTVVYQLAQEKVYECTNIDLITYANETNYIVNSGAIVPKTTLKVHNNISNVVSLLQKKVSLLESNVTKYMITQNRLMLASRYNADTVSFKVDVATLRNSFEYDNDLYELILNNVLVGKDNYNREYIENLIIFYWMDFIISDEMYLTLFEIIEEQHNPKVIEDEAPIE